MSDSGSLEHVLCLGASSLFWYQSTWNWLSATKCNVLHRCLELYKSCLQVQFKSLHIDFLPFCIAKVFFFQNVLYAWMYVRTRCYINVDIIMACCFNCNQGIQLCPICRTVITDCIKVYKY